MQSKSKAKFKVKSKFEQSTDEKDMSSKIANIMKKMRRRKNFTKRGVKKGFKRRINPIKRMFDALNAKNMDITN